MDHTDRMKFFTNAYNFAKRHGAEMCSFDMLGKRIGPKSKYGEVYEASLQTSNPIAAAVKLMPINHRNEREIQYYSEFNNLVTLHINPHFPIVFFSKTCKQCPFTSKDTSDCYVVMKEYANGDLKTWMKRNHTIADHLSFIAQLAIIIIGLAQQKVIHNDLHWGNLLFHKTPKKNMNKYMYYIVDGHEIYIKMTGFHWVVWDFGLSKDYSSSNPTKTAFTVDLHRITGIVDWIQDKNKSDSVGLKPLPPQIFGILDYIGGLTYNAAIDTEVARTEINFLISNLKTVMDFIDPTVLLIDPVNVPPNNHVINPTTPYMVAAMPTRRAQSMKRVDKKWRNQEKNEPRFRT